MPKDRDRAVNPAAAQRKAEKQKALKKGKAAVQAQRNERLAQRNPLRLERQIADLTNLAASSPTGLNARDKKQLEELERDLGRVRKAKEVIGDRAPPSAARDGLVGRGDRRDRERGGGILGKRSRDRDTGIKHESSGSETDESVRKIPMPRDTPPPVPAEYRRRHPPGFRGVSGSANLEPLGAGKGIAERMVHELPKKPEPIMAKTTYEVKPIIRDLRKEAVRAFVPTVVQNKITVAKGNVAGRLMEEEEAERLEREGYMRSENRGNVGGAKDDDGEVTANDAIQRGPDHFTHNRPDEEARRLAEEEERFSREVRMEEVSDEDL